MNLKFVTFEVDITQFLVDAKNYDEAVDLAIKANAGYAPYDDKVGAVIFDRSLYHIDDVVDMDFLGELMRRDDYSGNYDGVLIFGG